MSRPSPPKSPFPSKPPIAEALSLKRICPATPLWLGCVAWFALAVDASGQSDRVFTTDGKTVSGAVTAISKGGVQVRVGRDNKAIPAGQIAKVLFEGDPPPLTQGRESSLDGQHDQAIEQLSKVSADDLKRDESKADAQFYLARSRGELAVAGRGDRGAATKAVRAFITQHPESFHFYEAAELLGDLALAVGRPDDAAKFYGALRGAPTTETKARSIYLGALASLRSGKPDEAVEQLDRLIGLPSSTSELSRLQTLAKAAKAEALSAAGKTDEAIALTDQLVADLDPVDVAASAKIYNARGATFEAADRHQDAVLAYLKTHLMFAASARDHARAVSRLSEVWTKVGKPDRAGQMRSLMQQLYPGY